LLLERFSGLRCPLDRILWRAQNNNSIPQSAVSGKTDARTQRQENVAFSDEHPGEVVIYRSPSGADYRDGYTTDATLARFLARPVRIHTETWTEAAEMSNSIAPWNLYFATSEIAKKLDNYALLRCVLKIKVLINASPFYHGLGLISYKPLANFAMDAAVHIGGDEQKVSYSQRPHIYIYPQHSQGGELTLPFLYHRTWLRVGIASDFTSMGTLRLDSIGVLRNANSVTGTDVTVQIYAWAEDVELTANTTQLALQSGEEPVCVRCGIEACKCDPYARYKFTCPYCKWFAFACECPAGKLAKIIRWRARTIHVPTIFPIQEEEGWKIQAKPTKNNGSAKNNGRSPKSKTVHIAADDNASGAQDEYGTGPVSITASAVAAASGALSNAPIIGPYMKATSVVAKAASSVARFFGWTNPPVISNVEPFKNSAFPQFASSQISSPIEKLTVDPKQELCVDSRTVGLTGADEMTVESIVTRESFLVKATWQQTDAVDSILFSAAVQPQLSSENGGIVWPTPMSHLSQLFKYWRGDIHFRFQVVATQYHRGRLLITWDPYADNAGASETLTYSKVVDISDDDDFEVCIPYMQSTPWQIMAHDLDTEYWDLTGSLTRQDAYDNGILTLTVLTELTGPADGAVVDIAVSVRGASNLEFAAPQDIDPDYHYYAPQSYEEAIPYNIQSTEQEDCTATRNMDDSEETTIECMADTEDHLDDMYTICMGEAVKSVRSVMRRTTRLRMTKFADDTSDSLSMSNWVYSRFPLYSGYDTDGIDTITAGSVPYNYVFNTPLNWMTPCYVGQRGAINWHVNVISGAFVDHISILRSNLVRTLARYSTNKGYSSSLTVLQFTRNFKRDYVQPGITGQALFNQRTQAGASIAHPTYSRFRMLSTTPLNTTLGSAADGTTDDGVSFQIALTPTATGISNQETAVELFVAAGTDYTCFFYLNAPTVYVYSDPA